MNRWIVIVSLPTVMLFFAACAPKEQAPRQSSSEDLAEATPPMKTGEAVPHTGDPEPDWRARYTVLKKGFADRFVPPSPGSHISVRMKSGGERSGVLKEITSDAVVLSVTQGSVSLAKTSLDPSTRVNVFQEDFAHMRAAERLRLEKAAYEESHQKNPSEEAVDASGSKRGSVSPPPPARNQAPPENDPVDQSVWQVEAYLKKNLLNPETLQIHKWGSVEQVGKEYSVFCRYSAGGSSLGTTTMNRLFLMRENGRVYREVPVRDED